MKLSQSLRVLLTGAQGQLGQAIQALAPAHWQLMAVTRGQLDITQASQVRHCVQAFVPHFIINAAAYNAVDAAQVDTQTDDDAWRVNARGPGCLAQAANTVGARLLHVSTDYVFDGRQHQPYSEQQPPHPLNRYGASKLAGERAVLLEQPEALVVRTSWLFSEPTPGRSNFVANVVAQLAQSGQPLRVTTAQHSAPTFAGHLAAAIIRLLALPHVAGGIYHYRDSPDINRYGYVCTIRQLWLEAHALDANAAPPVQTLSASQAANAFAHAAPRPAYSVLGCQRLHALGIACAPWLPALRKIIQGLAAEC